MGSFAVTRAVFHKALAEVRANRGRIFRDFSGFPALEKRCPQTLNTYVLTRVYAEYGAERIEVGLIIFSELSPPEFFLSKNLKGPPNAQDG